MGVTYPALTAPTFSGDTMTVHRFMKDPTLVTRRAQELATQRYVADQLLKMPMRAENGTLVIETRGPIGANRRPQAVSPLGDYPLTTVPSGVVQAFMTQKWGQDSEVADESIARRKIDPVNETFHALIEENVAFIDGLAMSGITTAVTKTRTMAKTIAASTAEEVLTEVFTAVAEMADLKTGLTPDVAVLPSVPFALLRAKFAGAKILSDAQVGGIVEGRVFPVIDGITFLPSPNALANTMIVADSTRLGGMADESLGGPGYGRVSLPGAPAGIEAKSIRLEERDGYRLRVRRVTVPVIVEPEAAVKITGIAGA